MQGISSICLLQFTDHHILQQAGLAVDFVGYCFVRIPAGDLETDKGITDLVGIQQELFCKSFPFDLFFLQGIAILIRDADEKFTLTRITRKIQFKEGLVLNTAHILQFHRHNAVFIGSSQGGGHR